MAISKTRSKRLIIAASFLAIYLIFCQSCMTMRTSPKKTEEYFAKANITYIDSIAIINKQPLHYIATGDVKKPLLVFVHGSPGSWDAFKKYLTDNLLLQKYRMISVDRPGYGYSDYGEASGIEHQCRQITDLIKSLKPELPVVLAGHSLGGPIIVKMAADNPAMFTDIVVLSGSVDADAEGAEKWRYVIKHKPLRYFIPGALRTSNDEIWMFKQDVTALQPVLKNIICDVVIIHGTKDPLVPYSNVTYMQKEFVNAKSVTVIPIKDANHFIPWEHFEEIRGALLELKL